MKTLKHLLSYKLLITFSILCFIATTGTTLAQSGKKEIPPVDKVVILMDDYVQGVKTVKTVVIDFDTHPTDVRECKELAEDYDDFTNLDGFAICYYKGVRLTKYKL